MRIRHRLLRLRHSHAAVSPVAALPNPATAAVATAPAAALVAAAASAAMHGRAHGRELRRALLSGALLFQRYESSLHRALPQHVRPVHQPAAAAHSHCAVVATRAARAPSRATAAVDSLHQ